MASQPLMNASGVVEPGGHHQMSHHKSAPRQPTVTLDIEIPDLPVHFANGYASALRVVFGLEEAGARFAVPIFEVRHVDVHDAVHQLQAVQRVVGAGVVNDRQPQPTFERVRQRLQNLRDDMLWGDEIDVVATARLKLQHHGRQLTRPRLLTSALVRGLPVLTEDAFQVAPTEEDGSRALPAAQAVLLAKMGKVAGDLGASAYSADGLLVSQPVDGTIARTNRTAFQGGEGPLDSAVELAALPRIQICGPAHELNRDRCATPLQAQLAVREIGSAAPRRSPRRFFEERDTQFHATHAYLVRLSLLPSLLDSSPLRVGSARTHRRGRR